VFENKVCRGECLSTIDVVAGRKRKWYTETLEITQYALEEQEAHA
jgi:hypothetical protein